MKLLVTGGLGFIGSNFILKLLKREDIEITNVDAELFGSDHRNLSGLENSKKYNFVKGNISNKKLMEEQSFNFINPFFLILRCFFQKRKSYVPSYSFSQAIITGL